MDTELVISAERQFEITPWVRVVLPVLTEILDKEKKIILNELELSKRLLPFDKDIDISTVIEAAIYSGEISTIKEGEYDYLVLANPKNKKVKPKKKAKIISQRSIETVFDFWRETMNHKRAKLDKKRNERIKESLKIGYTVDDLKKAIVGCSLTPHNMGKNDTGSVYNGLHVILKDADQIDRFISNCESPGRSKHDDFDGIQEWLNEK